MTQNPETHYLATYQSLAKEEQAQQVMDWIRNEPLPFFKELRTEQPIFEIDTCTLLSRFDDVRDMLSMPKVFTVELYHDKMAYVPGDPKNVGYLMAHDDDALHYREKSIMKAMLNRDDLPRIRKLIKRLSQDIIQQSNGELELVNEYARKIPSQMVSEYFGFKGIPVENLMDWSYWNQYDCFYNQPFNLNTPELTQKITDEHNRCTEELQSSLKSLLIKKLVKVKLSSALQTLLTPLRWLGINTGNSEDDVLTRMLKTAFAESVDFNLERLGINAGGLLIGSVETTSIAINQCMQYLFQHPETLEQVKAAAAAAEQNEAQNKTDANEAFDAMVWEVLRFVPMSQYLFRVAAEDYVIAKGTEREHLIKKGTIVLGLCQSAMSDETSFKDPDSFQPGRNWYHQMNFGVGEHECVGKYIGMEMIPEMVKQLLLQPNLQPTSDMTRGDTPFPAKYPFTL